MKCFNNKLTINFIIILLFNLASCNLTPILISSDNNSVSESSIVFPVVQAIEISSFLPENIYYVDVQNPLSSDSNPGSEDCPFKTIECAYNKVAAGAEIIVKQGIYNERLSITKSGKSDKFIIFQAVGDVQTKGFLLYGNNIAVIGFNITGDETVLPWLGGGIWIHGSNLYIADNRISDFTSCAGIEASWNSQSSRENIHILNNHIYKCNKGIIVSGQNWLVEKNTIERLYRSANGGDCDNFRFFGQNNIIRENIMFGTVSDEIGDSHVDLFQSFDNNGNYAKDFLFEKNIGIGFFHQGVMLEGSSESHNNIIFYRNVFVNGSAWGFCIKGAGNVHIINNTVYNIAYHGIGFSFGSGGYPSGTVKNNIIAYSSSSYWADTGSNITTGYNLIYNCNNLPGIKNKTDIFNKNPFFKIGGYNYNLTLYDILGNDGTAFTDDDGLNVENFSCVINAGENSVNIGAY